MKTRIITLSFILFLDLCAFVHAEAQPSSQFEKLLYDRARFDTLEKLSDKDFVLYCTTLRFGGNELMEAQNNVWECEVALESLTKSRTDANPRVVEEQKKLQILRDQLAKQIAVVRKGLEIESRIAKDTLAAIQKEKTN